jgi:hypothetical protein
MAIVSAANFSWGVRRGAGQPVGPAASPRVEGDHAALARQMADLRFPELS